MTKKNVQENQTSDWVTVSDLCTAYNVSRATIHRWLKDSTDVRYYLKSNTMRVHREDFAAMIDSFVQETTSRNKQTQRVQH